MTKKKTWRYKCDHCGKIGYSGASMAKHEKHCTLNDNRECRVCKMMEGSQEPMAELVAAARLGLARLEEVAGGCPACMLAAIRRIPIHYPGGHEDSEGDSLARWKYKDAMKEVWATINEANCW